jgi:DNA-binding transcriptional LysR family regulator
VPAAHRLAGRRRVKIADLAGERVIALAEPTIFGSRTGMLLAGVQCVTVVTTPLSGIACTLVACGAGVAIVDPFSVSEFKGRGVVALKLEPPVDVRVAIVTAAERRLSALAQEFVDAFRRHVTAQ